MDAIETFKRERSRDIEAMSDDSELHKKSLDWMIHADKYKYTYNFSWLGRPIIKFPSDIMVMQEVIWEVKPDLIIETGIAHGGSIIFSASMLELTGGDGEVLGIDVDIRAHNRREIENHPMYKRITMLEGDSVSEEMVERVGEIARGKQRVMVFMDSCHTHGHVLKELNAYSEFVTVGSYLILADTFIEYFPEGYYDRPWDVGNNPMTAMREFLSQDDRFVIDHGKSRKAVITETFDGFLKRVK